MSDESFQSELMDWNLFESLSKEVAEKIIESGYEPDFMVGLARGGWVLSRVLCDYLGIKDLVSLKVEHWGVTATPDGKAQIKYPFDIDLTGKKVLIVDDITDTGESMIVAKDFVNKLNPREVKTVALRHIEGSKFVPDFFGDMITWKWVIFPWNYVEDMCNIIPRASIETHDVAEIKSNLKKKFGIDVSEEEIIRIQKEITRRNK